MVSLQDFISYANFKINSSYIAENLCINRAKPKSCCKGICFLNNSLEENHDENNNIPNSKKERSSIVYIFANNSTSNSKKHVDDFSQNHYYQNLIDQFSGIRVFHPPQLNINILS